MITHGTPKLLLSTSDRTKCSDRNTVYTIDSVLKASGNNGGDYNLKRSSLCHHRQQHRSSTTTRLKNDFNSDDLLTVHWDGKLMTDLTGDAKVDSLSIIYKH